jgi:hypothetical protein
VPYPAPSRMNLALGRTIQERPSHDPGGDFSGPQAGIRPSLTNQGP